MDQFFAAMDRDFDGRLTLEEFMGEMSPIEKLFILMDKNGDGFVTKKVNVNNVLNIPKLNKLIPGVHDNLQETNQGAGNSLQVE